MSSILINDLRPVGHSLFSDGESYLDELSAEDELSITGGTSPGWSMIFTAASAGATISMLTVATYHWWQLQ